MVEHQEIIEVPLRIAVLGFNIRTFSVFALLEHYAFFWHLLLHYSATCFSLLRDSIASLLCSSSHLYVILVGYVRQYNSVNSQPDVLNSLYSPLQPAALEGLRYFHNHTGILSLVFMKISLT